MIDYKRRLHIEHMIHGRVLTIPEAAERSFHRGIEKLHSSVFEHRGTSMVNTPHPLYCVHLAQEWQPRVQ